MLTEKKENTKTFKLNLKKKYIILIHLYDLFSFHSYSFKLQH